ncbi:hypothetical protein DFH08DRAFT_115762 [Mycena albidolilacea]|uniref:Calpain catalytic domain-containing protein n=1 Tax=Mycena albidolilacea TaxID=1033008 RepID=A0AAD7A6Q2_9AGAR|nr:hypothetical protein DFH08DRAFT_115762 [Mycena albidolilacea]
MPSSEDAESTYAKAVKAEFSKDYDAAFRLYIKAAESFLHLSRSVDHDREKTKWKTSAGKALERAEKIKAFVDNSKASSSDPSRSETRLTPVGVDHFSRQEQSYAVKKGGIINGRSFPLWDDKFLSNASPDALFEDTDGKMGLSPEQSKVFPEWRQPAVSESDGATADWRLRPQDILQHVITDCSVCASISVCLEHSQRFGSEFGLFSLRPAPEIGSSLVSPIFKSDRAHGRYDLRLLFNGAWRRIVIDGKLPYHPTTGALVCMSSAPIQGRSTTWPSLLEKGYMKLMGGYDFPGSNSSIDLHALVGWIPEHLEIKSPSFEREATWTRILDAFRGGQCMLTVGTGVKPNINWRGVRLLPSHSYAVIDVKGEDAGRGFTVLDSWVRSDESDDNANRTSEMLEIPWMDVLEVFESIYLSWDPRIWPKTLNFHGTWKQTGAGDQRSTRHLRLKFDNTSDSAQDEVWILLTRHVADTRRTSDFTSLRVQLEDDLAGSAESADSRQIATKGMYTNSTHVLAKTRLPGQASGILSVFAAYDGHAAEVGFTLSIYAPATAKIAWDESVPTPPFTSKVEGALTSKNAGGNSTHPTFMVNPQYHLRIHPAKHSAGLAVRKADVALSMQIGREVPVSIAVAWSQGTRLFELAQKDLAATSGAYSYGLARLTKPLQAGDYTIILSAFEPNQFGAFSLQVESSLAFDLKPIPQEGAGMYAKTVRGAWTAQNAMGGPSFKHYAQNPVFELDVQAPTELKIRLQLLRPKSPAALNLTLFPAPAAGTSGALGRHIATSGAYDDSVAGVATPQIALGVGKYWAVPSTYAPGVLNAFQLVVYSTAARVNVAERGR